MNTCYIYFICIFIMLIIISISCLICYPLYYHNHVKTYKIDNYKNFVVNKKDKEQLIKLYRFVVDKLNEHNIKFWLISGTLLGKIRHNGIIPWDNDVDLGIMNNDYDKVKKIFKNLKFMGRKKNKICIGCNERSIINYTTESVDLLSKTFQISYENWNGNIDIISFSKKDDKIIPTSLLYKLVFPNDIFKNEEIFPLKKTIFEGRMVMIPNKSLKILNRKYKNWRKKAIISNTHTGKIKSNHQYIYKFNST